MKRLDLYSVSKDLASQTKKSMGYIFVILCIPLLVLSIGGYAFTSYSSVEPIERDYARDVHLERGKYFSIWYSLSPLSQIFLNQSLQITFEVTDEEVIDFYVMSNSSYEEWKNGSIATGIVEIQATNHEDSEFIPPKDDKYYIVLDNKPYNSSKTIYLQTMWTATLSTVNYSQAFNWLKISVISLVLLIIGSFLSKNPIGSFLRKINEFAYLKEIRNVIGREEIKTNIDLHLKFFWFLLGVITAITFVAVAYPFSTGLPFLRDFPELFPMVADMFIRTFIYYYSGLIWISFLYLFWLWLGDFTNSLDVWYFVKVKNL